MRDPYSILGVQKDAGSDEIKAAWRSQAKAVHPDQNRNDPDATARFAEIGQAYDLLKDPKKRGLYDQARRAAESKKRDQTIMQQRDAARQAAERAKAADKLMEELARAQARTAKAEPASETAKPESAEDMLERIFGADAKAKVAAKAEAEAADNSSENGTSDNNDRADAGSASSTSFFVALLRRFRGTASVPPEKAPDITAEATVSVTDLIEQKWITLNMPEDREVRFQLEPGMTDGHVVRLKGQGLKLPDTNRGDLVVTLLVSRDGPFSIQKFDIHTTLPILLADAVLGCETAVQSPFGELKVTVPAWSGSDRAIRVEGKGLENGEGGRGDFVVELRIVLLDSPDAKVMDLMRHMREGLYI